MCVIVINQPGITIPFDILETATFNNPHGYGLILRDPKHKKLQVIKKCPKEGEEIEPKEIHKLMTENEDIERYLHLRWKTEGPIDDDNTHPFSVFHSNRDQIFFMHNGTLQDWKPRRSEVFVQGQGMRPTKDSENISDSKKFNDEFLQPLLAKVNGENGRADIKDPFIQSIIKKFWGYGANRGILVSSQQGYTLINASDWKTIKVDEKIQFLASNDDYFNRLKRGPEFDRQEKLKKEEAAKGQSRFADLDDNWPLMTRIRDISFNWKEKYQLKDNINKLLLDYNIWDHEGLAALENLTEAEVDAFCKESPEDAAILLIHMTGMYAELFKKYNGAKEHIASFHKDKKVG